MTWVRINTSTFCALRRGKYKYREKLPLCFRGGGLHGMILAFFSEKRKKKNKKNNLSYIYRTLLKCISTCGSRKGLRIRTVKLYFFKVFIKVNFCLYFFFFSSFNSDLFLKSNRLCRKGLCSLSLCQPNSFFFGAQDERRG